MAEIFGDGTYYGKQGTLNENFSLHVVMYVLRRHIFQLCGSGVEVQFILF
jgi:hypothetical protein